MQANIFEIFKSIQGEGKYIGVAQVFVRFAGCSSNCEWCDTRAAASADAGEAMDLGEVARRVKALSDGIHSVSLTGGEPLEQAEAAAALAKSLKRRGLKIFLETNGVSPEGLKKVIKGVDIVSMDMKCPSAVGGRDFWETHERFLDIAKAKEVYVKTVVARSTTADEIRRACDIIKRINPSICFVLQPDSSDLGDELLKKCAMFQKECSCGINDVRVIPQMHRLVGWK